MTSTLNVSKIEPLSGSGTVHVGSDSSNTITINTTTKAVTMSGNQTVSGNLNVSGIITGTGNQNITGILTANTANAILTTTSSNFKMVDLTTNPFYSTGTFTPFYSSSGATQRDIDSIFTNASYTHQYGTYTRIGDMVTAYVRLRIDHPPVYQNGGADSQGLSVAGLPFNVLTAAQYFPTSTVAYFDIGAAGGWTYYTISGYMQQDYNKKSLKLIYGGDQGTQVSYPVLTSHFKNGSATDFYVSFSYMTDDA